MKNAKIMLMLCMAMLIMSSCDPDDQRSSTLETNSTVVATTRTVGQDMLIKSYPGKTVIYNISTEIFYFVQHAKPIDFPNDLEFGSFNNNELTLIQSDANEYILNLDYADIYGIGEFSGSTFSEQWLDLTSDIPTLTDDDQELSCHCNTTTTVEDCDSGGTGSTGCSVTDGGGAGTVNWNNACSVDCGPGYYACCNEVAPIPDDE